MGEFMDAELLRSPGFIIMDDDYIPFIESSEDESFEQQTLVLNKSKICEKDQNRGKVFCTEAPWFKNDRNLTGHQKLNQEIYDFVGFISPTPEEHYARKCVVDRVTHVINQITHKGKLNDLKVHVFGSYETKLYLPSSDIDVVIESEQSSLEEPKSFLSQLASALVRFEISEPGRCKFITKARVPIVKFTDKLTNYRVDISFNTKGVEGVHFVKQLAEKMPALKPLALILRQFLTQRSLNEPYTGGLGSYALICMIVSFFQMHPLLQAGLIKAKDNMGVLLLDFFELYGKNFNYDSVGISIHNGGFYFDKNDKKRISERKCQLSIEDPQDPENDLCKSSFAFNAVRQSFEHAHNILRYALKTNAQNESILASIIRISDDTLRHRFYIEQTTNF